MIIHTTVIHSDKPTFLKCAAAHYDQNTFTPRHTLYPTRGILSSSRRKSDILFEHDPLQFIDLQDQLNMFQATFCPSSGA